MEEVLAPIAFHGVLSVREDQLENIRDEENARVRLTARTIVGMFRTNGCSLSDLGQFPSPPQYTRIWTPKSRKRSPGLRNHTVGELGQNATTPITYGS